MSLTKTLLPTNGTEIAYEITDDISRKHYVFSQLRGKRVKKARDFIVGADKDYEDGEFLTAHEGNTRDSEAVEINGEQIVFIKSIKVDLPQDVIDAIKLAQDYEEANANTDIDEDTASKEYKEAYATIKAYFTK